MTEFTTSSSTIGQQLNTQEFIFAIWKNKNNYDAVNDITQQFSKYIQEMKIFKEIEFFLPQISHLLIHLVFDGDNISPLERFALLICDISIHMSLNLNFLLLAAYEDYQPEHSNGKVNANYNPIIFSRCTRLLQLIDNNVLYGLDKTNEIIKNSNKEVKKTRLLYKRNVKKSVFQSKGWKERYFSIEDRVFNCYGDEKSTIKLRSIHLQYCTIDVTNREKYPYYFVLTCNLTNVHFQLRAQDENTYNNWITEINEAINSNETIFNISNSVISSNQKKKYNYYKQQKKFITKLTEIAEKLRFTLREDRKEALKKEIIDMNISSFCYLPLCNSLSNFSTIIRSLPQQSRAFNTKARCPCLFLFEVEENEKLDTASFLSLEIVEYTEEIINQLITDNNSSVSRFINSNEYEPHKVTVWNDINSSAVETTISTSQETQKITVPEVNLIGESFVNKSSRLKLESPYGAIKNWKLDGLIAKSNDDVRQEVFVMQLMQYYQLAFQQENLLVWMHTYRILNTTKSTGLIQLIPDALSIDDIKKQKNYPGNLRAYYEVVFGVNTVEFHQSISNFIQSLAAYSIVSYLLDIKDRHNGNVMIDSVGHLIHIDFGFVFGLAPGKQFSMEKAPFKLTQEYMDLIGGIDSDGFLEFKLLCTKAMICARKHSHVVLNLLEIMSHQSNYPAFLYNSNSVGDFNKRLMLHISDDNISLEIDKLINKSYNFFGTKLYDEFQLSTNGIAP